MLIVGLITLLLIGVTYIKSVGETTSRDIGQAMSSSEVPKAFHKWGLQNKAQYVMMLIRRTSKKGP